MSLVQKSGGGGKQIFSGFSSRLHSFYISFYYLLYKLPMFTVQKLEKVEKRKDEFHKKLMILLLTDQTTINMLVSFLPDSFSIHVIP